MSDAQIPTGGGNTKYIVGGLILLAGAVGLIFALKPASPPPAPPTPAAAPKEVARVNPMAEPDLIIEDEPAEPDAATAEEVAPDKPKPRVKRPKRGAWECSGDLNRSSLGKVVAANRGQVRTCYERRLKVNSILQGSLSLKVKVGPGGKVTATQVTGSLRDNEVFGCVRRLAQGWEFPEPTGGDCAVVDIPFQFSPKN